MKAFWLTLAFVLTQSAIAAESAKKAATDDEDPPKWGLVVSHNGQEKDKQSFLLDHKRMLIPMGQNNWTCSVMPDPQGDKFKMGIMCTFEKQVVSLPVICHERMAKVSSLTVGNEKYFSGLALTCEPHRGRTKPRKN